MKISGFTMVKNATKLYYPIVESISSILPLVNEFIIALGDCDADDNTREQIEGIGSEKIKIIDTVWDLTAFPNGTENAHQTDIAKAACSGDWLFYLQADEVIHEKFLPIIRQRCHDLLEDYEVEGLLFDYIHFWGDYNHHQNAHGWYKHEVRVIRNDPEIHSWESAMSFRRIPNFDGKSYRKREGSHKLKVAHSGAEVFHYGWVRPPRFMKRKKVSLDTIHHGKEKAQAIKTNRLSYFDYGPLGMAAEYKGSHPKVMEDRIAQFDWGSELNYGYKFSGLNREKLKHEGFKNRVISFVEQKILGGKEIGGFKNYSLLKDR